MRRFDIIVILVFLTFSVIGIFFMTNTEDIFTRAVVLSTDNSDVMQSSISRIGNQTLKIKLLEGEHEGEEVLAYNQLIGKLDIDNFFEEGDKIISVVKEKDGEITMARAVDQYRFNWEIILFLIFVVLLLIYARVTGVKALFSFIASLYVIWKILIPQLLAGKNPLIISVLVLILLSAIIIFSIAGFTKKGVAAFIGTISGLLIAVVIAVIFGSKFGLNGMEMAYAETLVFNGNLGLNVKHIFYAAVIIGASGAAMDIAMDVAASMAEVKDKKPDINFKELVQSGFNVGRAVIGTMTTTLLLAYSGGYLTLLMLFVTKNSDVMRILNYRMVSAEILKTVTGSIGLVLVAPITAVLAGWIYCREENS